MVAAGEKRETTANEQDSSAGHIGFFTLIGIVLLLLGWGWWKSNSLQPAQRFNVAFHDVAGLNTHASVHINGVRVGSVESLRVEGRRKVLVGIKVNAERVRVPVGSTFSILSNGVIGARYVEIMLPEEPPGAPVPALLTEVSIVQGEETVRPEFVINKLAVALQKVDIQAVDAKLSLSIDKLQRAADSVTNLAQTFKPAAAKAIVLEDNIVYLAQDIRSTTGKINHLLGNPKFSGDLKETAEKVRETAERVQSTMNKLSDTLSDKPLRQDLLSALDKIKDSTNALEESADTFQSLGSDQPLRNDVKQMLLLARDDLDRLNQLVGKSNGNSDLKGTLAQTREAIQHINLVAQQLNQILDTRSPLIHLLIGRPGHIRSKMEAAVARPVN